MQVFTLLLQCMVSQEGFGYHGIHECTHTHTVQIPTLSCYSTVVVVKNMLNVQVQADQADVGSG